MNGVVRPHAIPTRRKPTTHLQVGGEVSDDVECIDAIPRVVRVFLKERKTTL